MVSGQGLKISLSLFLCCVGSAYSVLAKRLAVKKVSKVTYLCRGARKTVHLCLLVCSMLITIIMIE